MTGDGKPLLLVVDDDPTQRFLFCRALQKSGFDVEAAADGEAALAAYARRPADGVLLDALMSGMDGYAVCAAIRTLPGGADVPVLMVTGLDDSESIQRAFDATATDVISKPINLPLLVQRVRYMLRAS